VRCSDALVACRRDASGFRAVNQSCTRAFDNSSHGVRLGGAVVYDHDLDGLHRSLPFERGERRVEPVGPSVRGNDDRQSERLRQDSPIWKRLEPSTTGRI